MVVEKLALHLPGKGSINLGVAKLLAVSLELGGYLLQPIHCLVVVVGRGSVVVVEGYHALSLSLHLGILCLGGIELNAIVGVVELGKQLPLVHHRPFINIYFLDSPRHLERQVGIFGGFNLAGKLEHGVGCAEPYGIDFHRLCRIIIGRGIATRARCHHRHSHCINNRL